MKKILLTSIIALVAFASFSQVTKGTKIIGGSGTFITSFNGGGTALSLQPRLLYAVSNHVALGGSLGINIQSGFTNVTIGPEGRYYFKGSSSAQPFLLAGVGINTNGGNATFTIGGGEAFYIRKNVALELTGNLLFVSNNTLFIAQAGFAFYLD
jgi:hypothetical protein